MSTTELATWNGAPQPLAPAAPAPAEYFMPIVDVQMAIARRGAVEAFAKHVMVAGIDYGPIPGASAKKVLLKAGAEKLCSFFGLVPEFVITHAVLDFDGAGEGNGEALIYYRIRCDLRRSGVTVGSGDASCSSRESKYRWRNAARSCPQCGQAAIIKGKSEYGGGWVCFKKSGGCGAKFADNDPAITGQPSGRTPNPDIADLDNTVLKMASKRALVAATLIATNVSDFFTQDVEDFADIEGEARPVAPAAVDAAEQPVWKRWKGPQQAIDWAAAAGLDGAGAAYQALKTRINAANSGEMYPAWHAHVLEILKGGPAGAEPDEDPFS